ncbi:apolipoprotein N-acyltransferase [Saccharopolyspora hirsuta]|uniref:apolipoprotein N-acyltransferase n=1 Tax=Saccharopolyspora hirsuta TaxID=1837 RepID=UPI0033327E3F
MTGSAERRAAVWWVRPVGAAAGGALLYAASPPRSLWWLAPLAFAALALSVWGRRARNGFGIGFVFGLAYLLPLLRWLHDFLGDDFGVWPWLGLVAVEALFFGLTGAVRSRVSTALAASVWMAAVVVAAEALRSRFPYGGFPWGRIAFTQGEGMFLPLAAIGGAALVTFALALSGCGLAMLVRYRREPRQLLAAVAALLLPAAVGLTVPAGGDAAALTVGVIQGGAPDVGLGLIGESTVVRRNHVAEADRLAAEVRSGRLPEPDLLIFPESSNRFGPARTDPDLDRISAALGRPLLVGGIARDADGATSNRVLRWEPGRGATAEYAKQRLVPFSEFIPLRQVAGAVTPFAADMPEDMVAGADPGVFDVGPARIGVAVCYEVAYDHVLAEAAQRGANLLVVPTNNAWFGRTEMTYQQLAMARLRAVEHDRAVVVASTSGVSAIVRSDGALVRTTGQFTAESFVEQVPLRTGTTLATNLGSVPALGLIGLVLRSRTRTGR